MNEQLLKDFIATAQKYNYNWNKAFGLFPELKGYDQQLLKDYVATAEKKNYDYKKVNSLFPELGFNQEPVKKKDSTVLDSKLEKPTSASSSKRRFEGVTEEPISQKKFRTDDYIDQVQNAQKKPSATNQKVESTFEQPKETKPTIEFDALSDKEAMQMMAEDFGKKEFELYSKISDIDKNVFEQGETEAVKYLNDQFKGSGFVFEETGAGNAVRIKSTLNDGFGTVVNEKVVELPTTLFPTMGAEKSKAAEQSMKEISDFMNQAFLKKSEKEFLNKDVKDYGQLVKLAVTNPQKYGESFLNQYDTEKWIDRQYIDLVTEGKSIKREQQLLEQETKAYQESGVFNEETERMLRGRAANLQNQVTANTQKYEEMKDITAKLPQAAAVYFQKKEKEGNLAGLVSRSLLGGLLNMEKMLITTAADVAPLIVQPLLSSSVMIPEVQQVRLKAAGMTDAQIKDYAAKQLRKGVVKDALKAVDDLVSFGTTEEYVQSGDRNDLEKVVNFLGESVGTAISAGGNPILQSLAFFSQSYNAIEEEMNSPEFDGLTQMEKKLMSVPYGLVIGQLDKLGFNISKNVAKSPLFNKLVTNTIARAFTSVPKDASIDVMQKAIESSLTATMARAGLNIVGGSLVEGTTEGTQSLSEYTMKNIYNNVVADKDVFQNVPDITTKEGFDKALSAAGEEFYYGALGGAIMGAGGTAIESLTKGFNKGEKEFDFFEKVINDPNLRSLIQTDIKTKITSGELTKAEAYEQIDAINKSVSILNSMPSELPVESKREAYNLILERNKIEKQIEGKDPNLVAAQTERVKEINEQLKGLSYAVQKQGADAVPVQSGAGVGTEMETGVSKTEPQGVIGETITEEVEVEGTKAEQPQAEVAQEIVQSEENQSLIDDYVQRQTEFINSATVISQEEKQQRIQELEADPVAFAEKNASVTEIEGETPHTDLLNSLQRQPAAETATTEKLTVNPSEGYSFEYESENDVPAELKGVEPTGRTETKVGRGKKAKTKLKLTFTGQQLIDSGLAVTPEAQAAVAQAEPTAKIETIEVQEVPQVEQTLNDLTQQNNVLTQNDFTAARVRNVGKEKVVAQVARAAKAIAKVLPKVKIVVHATPEAFVEATKDMDGRLSEGGLYDRKTGQIHINLEKATNRTVPHEVFHALILSRVNTDLDAQRLTRSMIGAVRKSLKKAEGTAELMSYLEDFESNYDENIKNEEKLAELFAILADNYKQLPPASKNVIIRFLNRLAKAIGLKEMTDREAIAFMNTLSRKVEMGQEIEAREVGQQKEGEAAVRKQKGLINLTDQEAVKYARAGVENKYDAQAIKQIGLQGTKFDKTSILERIQKEFDGLVKNTTDYIFREDSPAIDQAIQNEIDTMVDQGFSNAQIENAKRAFSPGRERDNVINEYRRAQVETANQWESYLGQSDYPASFKYLILDAVLTNNYDLKTDRYQKRTGKTIRNFTPFDAGTLAELYMSESNELLKDYVRIQADNSANIVESAAFSSTKDGKWIKFDGGDGVSQQELQDNANKLSQLVQNTYWCTKTNALSQLRGGDFYVYVTENKQGDFDPRIAVRMDGDKVGEVRGNASSKQDLEADMLPVADTFLREKIPNDSGKKWLDSIAYNTKVKDLTEKIDTKVLNMDDVYEYIDIIKDKDKFSVDYGENGLVQALQDKFRNAKFSFGVADSQIDIKDNTLLLLAPNDMYTFMFRDNEQTKNVQVIIGNVNVYDNFDGGKVKAITGNVEFEDSSIKEIKSIESIGGNVSFRNSEIKYLGSLKEIGGDVSFRNSEVRYLGNLKSIGGRAIFRDSEVRSLENLEYIGGNADFYNSSIQDLGSLKEIGGYADFEYSSIQSLDSLKKIGGDILLENSDVKDLGELTEVGGTVNVNGSNIKSLGKLKKARNLFSNSTSKLNDLGELTEIVSNLNLYNNYSLKSLGKLKSIGGHAEFVDSKVEDLGELESIGRLANFTRSKIKSLGNLKSIGGTAQFSESKVEDLGSLKEIGGNAYFDYSQVKSLGNLKSIGENADFEKSNVEDLGDLESIGRDAIFYNSKVEDLGNLQFIGGAVSFQGKPELREQWEQRQERQFAVRKQKTTGPSRIVENGVKAGKTDAEIRQEGKAAGFTNKEMTEALSKYYTKEQGIFMKSGIKGKVGQFVDFAKRWKQQFLTSKGLLPKIGFTYKEKMEGEISAEANRAAKTAKKFGVLFDKFTGDKELLKDAFDKALRGDKSIQLPAGFAGLANEMRNHIDRLSQMLIATGAVEGDMADAIRENMGTYITRSYEIFDNKNFRQKAGEQELQAAKNFLRTQPGMIALAQSEAARTGTTVDEALDVLVDNKIDEYFADAETGALVKGSKLGSKDLSTLKERKEIPEQIRMLMGEYSDPAMNYARTVLNIASLAARHQFLTQVKEAGMGKFFFEKNDSQRPKGFDTEIAAEGSDTMSPLNGLMTTPEIAEAFGLYGGQKGEDNFVKKTFRLYYKAMGMVKWLKTIASFATHMKNVFSNLGFVGLNGHSLIEIGKAANVVLQDLKTMSKPEIEAKIDEYIKAGIMRQGAGINEIKDMFKDADMDDFLERRLSMRKPNKGVVGKIKQVISSKASKIKTGMEDLYQAEDDMFKIAAYETEMNRYADALYNKSKDQLTDKERQEVSDIAANNVKNTYPTYSRIPEGIKQLRKFPLFIGSFISFQAESYRTAYNTIGLAKDELSSDNKKIKAIGVRRVAGAGSYLTVKTALLSYAGYAAGTGIGGVLGAIFDDDDEEKKQKEVRSFLPPWSKNSDLIILKAADGEIEYIDFSASDPHGGINKALNALLNGEDMVDSFKESMLELVGQFQGPDILTNLAIQLKENENDFGKPIYNEEDSRENKISKVIDYVYKVVEPGTATSIRKAVGSEQSLGQLAFGEATGLKIRKVNVKDQFGYKLPEFDDSFKDIRKIYNSEYYKSIELSEDPKATKKDIQEQNKKTDEALIEANEKYAAKAKELMDLINSANRLGVDYDELINELGFIKSTMGKSNISEMENGGDEFIKEKED